MAEEEETEAGETEFERYERLGRERSAEDRATHAPPKPSDLLDIRRTLSRRTFGPPPTAAALRAHAERYGTDGVAETGAEAGMSEESLTALIASLDRINATFRRDAKRKHLYRTPPRGAPDRRARELLGIPEPEPLAKPSRPGDARGGTVRRTRTGETRNGRARKETTRGAARQGP